MFPKHDMDIKKTCDKSDIKNTPYAQNMGLLHGTPLSSIWRLCVDPSSPPALLSLPLLASLESHQIRPSQKSRCCETCE